ncbi:unnamed protein product, partial [Heterosigma akashiwo]
RTWVVPEGFDHLPEAADRPGHFRGVATVVAQLLNLARPHRSYFGQKDALQCAVLRRVAADLRRRAGRAGGRRAAAGGRVVCPRCARLTGWPSAAAEFT